MFLFSGQCICAIAQSCMTTICTATRMFMIVYMDSLLGITCANHPSADRKQRWAHNSPRRYDWIHLLVLVHLNIYKIYLKLKSRFKIIHKFLNQPSIDPVEWSNGRVGYKVPRFKEEKAAAAFSASSGKLIETFFFWHLSSSFITSSDQVITGPASIHASRQRTLHAPGICLESLQPFLGRICFSQLLHHRAANDHTVGSPLCNLTAHELRGKSVKKFNHVLKR